MVVIDEVRRKGLGRANSSRSHSPIGGGGEGDANGWTEAPPPPPNIYSFTATPAMTCSIPTTPLGFFQLIIHSL